MAKTYQEIMDEARKVVPEVSPDEVKSRHATAKPPVVLDVREREEFRQGYIPGAVSIPRGFLEMRVEEAVPDKSAPIIAYCQGGTRSLLAGRILKELGYKDVEFYIWAGMVVPAATPAPAQRKLRDAVRAAVKDPAFSGAMEKVGSPVTYLDALEFKKYWDADAARLKVALQKIGKVADK